jgi:hypothetical protein
VTNQSRFPARTAASSRKRCAARRAHLARSPSAPICPCALIPWNIHGVWAPLDRILAKLELDGTAEYSGGEPVLYDPGTNDWHNSAQAIRGIAEFYQVAARRKGWQGVQTEPVTRFARLLELDDEITQQDIDEVRACSTVLRKLSGSLTLREARAYLDETCIKIEVEKAGLTESAA